jgi:GNAT superfamily N-acetyltransferase
MAIVRIITEADLPALLARFPDSGAPPVNRHVQRLGWQRDGHITYLAVWEGSEPVGHLYLRRPDSPDLTVQARILGCAELADLFVAEGARGRGHGCRLVEAAEAIATKWTVRRVGLEVTAENPFNAPARRLYQRLGYRDSGLAAFVSGYTYWDVAGVPHRDEELYRYFLKELVG